jgi:hypothetical protein
MALVSATNALQIRSEAEEDDENASLHLKCEDTRQLIGVQKPQQRITQTGGPAEQAGLETEVVAQLGIEPRKRTPERSLDSFAKQSVCFRAQVFPVEFSGGMPEKLYQS